MIVTVSTVKDTLPHVQRFVRGNLAGGVDHMFVFLDAQQPEVEGWLRGHEHVTTVRTDEDWWRGERPDELNVRQRVNANLVKALLTLTEWAEWVFHIDGDEVAWIDRDVLAAAPPEQRAARLAPLEAVAQRHWDGDPTWFKRLLTAEELTDLHARGLLREPSNGAYFHGHPFGKTGVRPCLDLWLTLHHVVDADRSRVKPYARPRLRMLHYESYSGEDFVRKWTSILASGPLASFRAERERVALGIRDVVERNLPPEEAARRLMEIFAETTEDDLPSLRDRGLLVEADPTTWTHHPRPLPPGEAERVGELLDGLRAVRKQQFHPGEPAEQVRRTLDRLTGTRPGLRAVRSFLRRS